MDIKIKLGMASLAVVIFQSILKLYGAFLTNSLSLMSETLDTITDIGFVSLTIYSLFQSQKPPDYEHMYGHSKMEPIGALIQGIILLNLYGFLIFLAVQSILNSSFQTQNPEVGIQILIVSIVINIIFSRFLIWKGRAMKSLVLEMQGLNLFQDSLRGFFVIINFIFVMFSIYFLDPLFSIGLSIWVIIGAVSLSKKSVKDISDTNPATLQVLEELRIKIFHLDHVNAVEQLRVRASGMELYLEVHLLVEDHITLVHANEINVNIKTMARLFFPNYEVKCLIEMNPLSGEGSLIENISNLISSMISEFPGIIDVKHYNISNIEKVNYLTITIIVDENLTLFDAHHLCTEFEDTLMEREPLINKITSHIECSPPKQPTSMMYVKKLILNPQKIKDMEEEIKKILDNNPHLKDYHDLNILPIGSNYFLDMHIMLDGSLNIALVHEYLNGLEQRIRKNSKFKDFQEILLHSEPYDES